MDISCDLVGLPIQLYVLNTRNGAGKYLFSRSLKRQIVPFRLNTSLLINAFYTYAILRSTIKVFELLLILILTDYLALTERLQGIGFNLLGNNDIIESLCLINTKLENILACIRDAVEFQHNRCWFGFFYLEMGSLIEAVVT